MSLLSALGYQQQPSSYEEEKALWQRISAQLLYADSRDSPLEYKDKPSRAIATPLGVELSVDRQVRSLEANGNTLMEITVLNVDLRQREAASVRLIETIPDGYKFVLDSASVSVGSIKVRALKPLEFVLDPIAAGKNVIVRYTIKATSP
jgi:hypothetical protein